MDPEEEFYRQPRRRVKRGLEEEIAKFSLCLALSEHQKALGHGNVRQTLCGMDIAGIKAGILSERLRPGDVLEGEALACAYTAIYQPRAYYPAYFLGEMRAALRRGESAPQASPHYLPVSLLPTLPGGWRVIFLYPCDKAAFERPDFPAGTRDVLTRDYLRLPMLVPPGVSPLEGRIRFRAGLLQLNRASMDRLAGMGEKAYDVYSARGLTYFLRPLEEEKQPFSPLEAVEGAEAAASLRGSLFAEISLKEDIVWERMVEVLEGAAKETVEELFPACTRGERQGLECYLPHSGFHAVRFRRRLFALVYDPVIVIFRAPGLLGLYLPSELMGGDGESADLFWRFVIRFTAALESGLNLSASPRVEIAYDNRLPWAREKGALLGPAFEAAVEKYPFLGPTLAWLRG